MPEKSLLAYFHSREEAERALEQMRGLRLIDSSIDRISRYPGEGIENQMNPVTGDFPGLGNLVLDADYSGKARRS